MSTSVKITNLPKCDLCRTVTARFDGRTIHGPWAYMCQACFDIHGVGLGTGFGQELILIGAK